MRVDGPRLEADRIGHRALRRRDDHAAMLIEPSRADRDQFRAAKIGYVFQTFNLLPAFSALENVMIGMAFADGRADRDRALASKRALPSRSFSITAATPSCRPTRRLSR